MNTEHHSDAQTDVAATFTTKRGRNRKFYLVLGAFMLVDLVFIAAVIGWVMLSAPGNFVPTDVVVEPGQTVSSIASEVAEAGVVRNGDFLYLTLQALHREKTIKAGTYQFTELRNTLQVAEYLTGTVPQDPLVRITIPEGVTNRQIAEIVATELDQFDPDEFLSLTVDSEGLMWPETYYVPEDFTAQEVEALLNRSYLDALADLQTTLTRHPLGEEGVVNLASIVEREANTEASMKMVAGILLNRLNIGMALQADATIEYVLDTPLGELPPGVLASELRERESPYNTYLNTGLPPTAIGNPGRQSIEAVLFPTESDYLFYITGADGEFYYAETFDQHRLNISRHLR